MMGLVKDGKFKPSVPSGRDQPYARLTTIQPQAAQSPESGEINLGEYEGRAIMVRGNDQGSWIYGAEVVETAGPILSAVVERLSGL
jgi:hypothetical protein